MYVCNYIRVCVYARVWNLQYLIVPLRNSYLNLVIYIYIYIYTHVCLCVRACGCVCVRVWVCSVCARVCV